MNSWECGEHQAWMMKAHGARQIFLSIPGSKHPRVKVISVTLVKILNLHEPQLPYLWHEDNNMHLFPKVIMEDWMGCLMSKTLHSDWSIIGTQQIVVSFFFPLKQRNLNKAATGVSILPSLAFVFVN